MSKFWRTTPLHRWLLGGILGLALFLRLYQLGSVPVGINGDELFNAIDAAKIGGGNWPVYFPGNMGRESLFFYLIAAAQGLLGRTIAAFRLPAALLGVGSVLLAHLLGRDLFQRRVGLLAAGFTAVSLWPLMQSRWGLRAVSLTFFTGLSLYLLQRAVQNGRWQTWLLGGLAVGLTLYTYIPARLFPLVILIWWGWLAWERRELARSQWRYALLSVLAALLVFAPFGWYMAQHPDLVNQRIYSMTAAYRPALQGEFAPLWAAVKATLAAFSFQGDPDWRYHVGGKPLFDPLTSLFFYLGAALSLRNAWRKSGTAQGAAASAYALLWLWAGAMFAPNALLDAKPSFLRAAGAILPVYLLATLGVEAVNGWLQEKWAAWRERPYLFPALVVVGLGLTLANTWHSYFVVWNNYPEVRDIYQGNLTMMGHYLAEQPLEGRVFIAHDYAYDAAPRTLAYYTSAAASWFIPTHSFVAPQDGPAWYLTPLDASLLLPLPATATIETYANGDPAFALYRLTAPPDRAPAQPMQTAFVDGPLLAGYDLPLPVYRGEKIAVMLHWHIPPDLPTLPTTYTYAQVRLQDGDGRVWSEGRKLLGYPQASWQAGDRIWQEVPLEIPAGLPPGAMTLRFGLTDGEGDPVAAVGEAESVPFLTNGRPLPNYVPDPETTVFADVVALQQAQLSTLIEPGLGVDITLDWVPLRAPAVDYMVEFQLFQPGNPTPILRQTLPILPGQYPPSRWVALEPVRSRHRLQIPIDLPTVETELTLRLALLGPAGEALPLTQGSADIAQMTLQVRERLFTPPPISQPVTAQFGSAIRLLGYDLATSQAQPGGELALTLYWQALDTPQRNYTVFTHVAGADGQLRGQFDGPPSGAAWLTSSWLPQEVVVDQRVLPIFADAPAGEYAVFVGLYTEDGRLPVVADGVNQPNDQFLLTTITVAP